MKVLDLYLRDVEKQQVSVDASRSIRVQKSGARRRRRASGLIEHGTRYTYVARKCRCEECREANRAYQRERHNHPPAIPPNLHGTQNAYIQLHCRCQACRDAAATKRREREHATRDRKCRRPGCRRLTPGDQKQIYCCEECRIAANEKHRRVYWRDWRRAKVAKERGR